MPQPRGVNIKQQALMILAELLCKGDTSFIFYHC